MAEIASALPDSRLAARDDTAASMRSDLEKRREAFSAQELERLKKGGQEFSGAMGDLKAAEAMPVPDRQKADLPKAPSGPIVDSKQYESLAYGMIGMAMIGGAASKGNWLSVSAPLNGALKGYLEGNHALAQKEYKDFQVAFDSALQKQTQADNEFKDAWNKKNTTISQKMNEVRMIALRQGREDMIAATTQRDIGAIESKINNYETATDRLRLQKETIDRKVTAQQDKGWKLMKDKAGQVYRVNVNAGLQQKQTKGGWEDVDQLPPDVMNVGAKENQGRMFEEKAGMQYNTMKLAIKELDELEAKGVSNMPFLGDISFDSHGAASATGRFGVKKALSDDQQQLVTAAQLFAEAAGHLERGANLTDQQFQRVVREFIPQPGDKEGTLKMKKEHRRNILEGGRIVSGEVGAKIDQRGAGATTQAPPAGVDPVLWQHMTPEERSLWQK